MVNRVIGIITEKNCDSVITKCNDAFLIYAGVKSHDNVIGYTDYDFPWNEYADIYRNHELEAISGNNYSSIIPFKIHSGDDLLFLHTKVQNKDAQGNVIGVFCHAVEIINPDIAQLINILKKESPAPIKKNQYFLGKQLTSVKLSYRHNEILFYLARGKTVKLIARFMGLSARTIEFYIENIKEKLGCRTKSELIDFAIENGFMNKLPNKDSAKKLIETCGS